ncbi:hypothetical protein PO909_010386 [Leuciscus waleckii]
MNEPEENPADRMSSSVKPNSDDLELLWQSAIADSKDGKLPFPPQGELTLRRYAQVVEGRRFFLPETLVNRYFIAGLNDPPPLSEREALTLRPFREVVDRLSRRESQAPTSSSSAKLPMIPEGRVLAVVMHGDQAHSAATHEASPAPTSLRGKWGRRLLWESASESSATESILPETDLSIPVTVPAELPQPVAVPAMVSAPRPRRKRRRRKGVDSPKSLPFPESVRISHPSAASKSAAPEPTAVPESAAGRAVPGPAEEGTVPESAVETAMTVGPIPESAAGGVVSESAAEGAVPESVVVTAAPELDAEKAAADSAAEAVLQSLSAYQEMPVVIAAETLSNYFQSLAKILETPKSVLSSVSVPNTTERASPEFTAVPESAVDNVAIPESAADSAAVPEFAADKAVVPDSATVNAETESEAKSADSEPASEYVDFDSASQSSVSVPTPQSAAVFHHFTPQPPVAPSVFALLPDATASPQAFVP